MRNLRNPRWLLVINTLPVIILFLLFISQFNIIKSLLEPENIRLWKIFGITIGSVAFLNFLYTVFLIIRKKPVSALYGLIALLVYIPIIYLYGSYSDDVIPFSIPRWMIPGDMFLYVGTFLMPTLAYALFILVSHFTTETKEYKAWKNFAFALSIPLLWYVFYQVILPLWKPVNSDFGTHALIVFVIAGTLFFLFFLIRGVFILATKKAGLWKKYPLAWKIPISILLPVTGLLVNNGFLFLDFDGGIFGDFNNIWFYALAVLNGLVICLPDIDHQRYRLLLFAGRSITFAFTVYFFLVFLPFLPLSVIAIAAIGSGFLMLTPLVLFVVHVNVLSRDYRYLETKFRKWLIRLISVVGFCILPLIITITFLGDRNTLEKTLDYLYTPDYQKTCSVNEKSLEKTMNLIKQHKDRSGSPVFGSEIPYISVYFNWLVLDNLTLSDAKINYIDNIFFGSGTLRVGNENIRNRNVDITDTDVESVFDESQNAWRSWINLEITNKNHNSWDAEYATTFYLPAGCWISDYYLYVGDKKEMGILAEKKAAMWVFSNIRNINRDPGILYYLTGNKVAFRVFPFGGDEVRRTGIELIHREPVTLTIDGIELQLGESSNQNVDIFEDQDLVYIPAARKSDLKENRRQPYFHFLVDVSEGEGVRKDEYISRINRLMEQYPEPGKNARISTVNAYVSTFGIMEGLESLSGITEFQGGFYLDRAIRTSLVHSYYQRDDTYPVIIVVTDSIEKAVLDKDFSDLEICFPENDLFYLLTEQDKLEPHSLTKNPGKPLTGKPVAEFNFPSLEYKADNGEVFYISTDSLPALILKSDFVTIDKERLSEKDWASALRMNANWISQALDPSLADAEWLSLVKSSFITRVMTPATSYLVVENEAQKAILKKKQEQILASNKSFDPGEDAQSMSEPGLIILAVLLGLLLFIRERRKQHKILVLKKDC